MRKIKRVFTTVLIVMVFICSLAIPSMGAEMTDFEDLKADAWYYPSVSFAVETGMFTGTTDTTFSPNTYITRAMFITVLGRYVGINTDAYNVLSFYDVPLTAYYAPYASWAKATGIASGTSKTAFAPNRNITREQVVTILYNYAKAAGNSVVYDENVFDSYIDTALVSSYAVEPMKWALSKGIISGIGDRLSPVHLSTRAQVAQMFQRLNGALSHFPVQDVTPTPLPPQTPSKNIITGYFGITREKWMAHLNKHSTDKFYLTTPYIGGKWSSPNGNTSYNGAPGMNCTGFIAAIFRELGMTTNQFTKSIKSHKEYGVWADCAASNWYTFVKVNNIKHYIFNTKEEMVKSGKVRKGDVVIRWAGYPSQTYGTDNHMLIYWGDEAHPYRVWHSIGGGNQIGNIRYWSYPNKFIVLPIE